MNRRKALHGFASQFGMKLRSECTRCTSDGVHDRPTRDPSEAYHVTQGYYSSISFSLLQASVAGM